MDVKQDNMTSNIFPLFSFLHILYRSFKKDALEQNYENIIKLAKRIH
jgi:hypothetical protein